MPATSPQPWPFPVLAPELRTEQHWKEIRFLETALNAGFSPCKFADGEYQAHVENGRYAWIISRGRVRKGDPSRWEVWLDEPSGRAAAWWVDDFGVAARAVIKWLEGADVNGCESAVRANEIVSHWSGSTVGAE